MPGTVLVVDDDTAFRGLATQLLRDWGYDVIGEAGSVAEAVSLAARQRPQLALVDIALPDGTGFDLARLWSAAGTIRVVLVSADSDPAYVPAAHRAGARGFLAKDALTSAMLREILEGR